jgi:hypothetical protein
LDAKTRIKALQQQLHGLLMHRDGKIMRMNNINGLNALAELSHHTELLSSELRAALTTCHDELQALGHRLPALPMPNAPDINVQVNEKSVRIAIDGMLPYKINGSAHYLHEKLDAALTLYAKENALPRPLFSERCAVVFIHHYRGNAIRNMRDYDNVEHRCITNVIARHFLRDDSPACYISMDMLAISEITFTEIRLLTISAFRELVESREIELFL